LANEFERDAALLEIKRRKLGVGREMSLRHIESLPVERRPRAFYGALEKLNARIDRAMSPPAPDAESEGAYASAIIALLASLPHDAEATTL
jgi:hypothetical protein